MVSVCQNLILRLLKIQNTQSVLIVWYTINQFGLWPLVNLLDHFDKLGIVTLIVFDLRKQLWFPF